MLESTVDPVEQIDSAISSRKKIEYINADLIQFSKKITPSSCFSKEEEVASATVEPSIESIIQIMETGESNVKKKIPPKVPPKPKKRFEFFRLNGIFISKF